MNERLTSVALTTCSKPVFGREGCGSSGILINDNWIISHGSLVNSKVSTSSTKIREFFENLSTNELTTVPEKIRDDLKVRIYQQRQRNFIISNNNGDNENVTEKKLSNDIDEKEGSIIVAWKCSLLDNTIRELFYSWNFDKTRQNDRSLLSIFLIIALNNNEKSMKFTINDEVSRARQALNRFVDNSVLSLRNPSRSLAIEISSTPFGNPVFIDSISRGVISNVFGDYQCLMLTDANAVPGSEGAPVYVTRSDGTRSNICGMVIAPLSWCRGEWVDYTFAASLLPCLSNLLRPRSVNQQIVDKSETGIADSLDKSLVLVRCGDSWGTGIIFDARTGTIITCSHVVHKAPESRIKVVLRRDDDSQSSGSSTTTSSWAKLVYRTARGEPYDVAILSLDPREIEPTLRSIRIADDGPVLRGETVGSAGFPFFSSRFPTITRGNVSGITECMLRTTCCVQSGSSGGPIVRWSTGEMLGMVVCNAITTNKTKLYPRLNMAVPITILVPPINEYLRTGQMKALEALASKDPNVRRTWNFHRLPSSKI